MSIKPAIYDNLTPRQRVIAAFEAFTRGDVVEEDRIISSCPMKQYKQRDFHFSGTYQAIMGQVINHDRELTHQALTYFAAIALEDDTPRAKEISVKALQNFANELEAWHTHMESMGISKETIDKASSKIRHPCVDFLLERCNEDVFETELEKVERKVAYFKEFFDKILDT